MSPWTFPTCRASTTIHRPCSLEERLWNPWEHYASGGLGALEPNHLKAETPVTNRCRDKLGREVNLAQVAEVLRSTCTLAQDSVRESRRIRAGIICCSVRGAGGCYRRGALKAILTTAGLVARLISRGLSRGYAHSPPAVSNKEQFSWWRGVTVPIES
jgi:hypothetical protein